MAVAMPNSTSTPPAGVRITRDIVYGHAPVRVGSPHALVDRTLRLDLYEPAAGTNGVPRPVVVLAFGGAFHRGSRADDSFEGGAMRNTSIAAYCRRFAERGFVACSIDYRLVPEDPEPGDTPAVLDAARIPRSRVDLVRGLMGLGPATDAMLWRGIESASDDMAMAVRFVVGQAAHWQLDPDRIVLGGFSAGARTALNAAFAERARCAAVVSLSGYLDPIDLALHAPLLRTRPAVLLVRADNDLDYIVDRTPAMARALRDIGVRCECVRVPGAGHFYPADAVALHETDGPTTVEGALMRFVDAVVRG